MGDALGSATAKQAEERFPRKLRMGMIGGGRGAMIGAVHRRAAMLDGGVELVAGAFSSTAEKSLESGRDLYVPDDRIYGSWQEMLEAESAMPEDKRLDFVSVVTPNHVHYPVALAFAKAGFNVACDKPLCHTVEQAMDLVKATDDNNIVFAVTYNYTGYPMVKQARRMVREGELGELRKVIVEYPQGWLSERIEADGQKQASWRTDPARSGVAGAMGDIGSHSENLMSYITGLEIESICADLTTFVTGRPLDDDGNILLRFKGGAKGILQVSQVTVGEENGIKIRVWGTKAGIAWEQENPNYLRVVSNTDPVKVMARANGYLYEEAAAASRIPTGHPEGYFEAFGNIYKAFTDTIRAKILGVEPSPLALDFPGPREGARGVYFIHRSVESSASDVKWLPYNPPV
ncbi:MAG: Gfo/Idh/MocA family oxidoreductase [Chloroflexi bacterium]|nr:Gfo/Idh/MocA family oxidoreductase [Chloroflexota bacterium]